VRPWMITEHALYEQLPRTGELSVDPALMSWRDAPEFLVAYDRMRAQMREHPWLRRP